jgi:hypothetical protein
MRRLLETSCASDRWLERERNDISFFGSGEQKPQKGKWKKKKKKRGLVVRGLA